MDSEFLSDLFGSQEGIVYAPVKIHNGVVKAKEDGIWTQFFFKWPQERAQLEEHLVNCDSRDVYLSPSLFTKPVIARENFKGTNYLWTEFDGTLPTNAIEPSVRIQSSLVGHEHWYWKLDQFVTDIHIVEDLTRRITYDYGADLSSWHYQKVLRADSTWNHYRNKPVSIVSKNNQKYSLESFFSLPIPPAGSKVEINLKRLDKKEDILKRYTWTTDALDLLNKDEIQKDSEGNSRRSHAYARFVHECLDIGLSDEEVFVLLEDRDKAWKKYIKRNDRQIRLEATIANVKRTRLARAVMVSEVPEVYRFKDFMNADVSFDWAIENLLPVAGSMLIFGSPGIGKSTFSLRLAISLAMGEDKFLIWNIVKQQRVLFVSLEMQHNELKKFFLDMKLSTETFDILHDNFVIWPIGNAHPFESKDEQIRLLKWIRMYQIELVIFDSLSVSIYGSVTDDLIIGQLNKFLNEEVRKKFKCSYIFIHHPRKGVNGITRKSLEQDDAYGSDLINRNAQTIMSLTGKKGLKKIHVEVHKLRMAEIKEEFYIERTSTRGFILAAEPKPEITTISSTSQGKGNSDKAATKELLGKLFPNI